jgi:hypothetical protein
MGIIAEGEAPSSSAVGDLYSPEINDQTQSPTQACPSFKAAVGHLWQPGITRRDNFLD